MIRVRFPNGHVMVDHCYNATMADEQETYDDVWGVLVPRADGTAFFASAENTLVFSTLQREIAEEFARQLIEQGIKDPRPVRIKLSVQQVELVPDNYTFDAELLGKYGCPNCLGEAVAQTVVRALGSE